MVDTQRSERCVGNDVEVRILSSAPDYFIKTITILKYTYV